MLLVFATQTAYLTSKCQWGRAMYIIDKNPTALILRFHTFPSY